MGMEKGRFASYSAKPFPRLPWFSRGVESSFAQISQTLKHRFVAMMANNAAAA